MIRHMRFQLMLATREPLSVRDQAALSRHLGQCSDCRQRATAYEQQMVGMRDMMPARAPARVRAAVLARAEASEAVTSRRWSFGIRSAIRLAAIAVTLAALTVNLPALEGAASSIFHQDPVIEPYGGLTGNGIACNHDGVALLKYQKILTGPQEFDIGAHGSLSPAALTIASSEIDHPIWYQDDDTGTWSGSCADGSTWIDVFIGSNPDAHTELHAYGRAR